MNKNKPSIDKDTHVRLARIKKIAFIMDTQYSFLGIPFGFDSIIGFFPIAGDIVGGLISMYIIWEARKIGVPDPLLKKMARNVVVDVVLGSTPVIGNIFDLFYKTNKRNLAIIERYINA